MPPKIRRKGKGRGQLQAADSDTSESVSEETVRERDFVASTPVPSSDIGYGTAPEASYWEAEIGESSEVIAQGIQTRAQIRKQALNTIKRLIIRRTEPGSPVLVSASGADLDATKLP